MTIMYQEQLNSNFITMEKDHKEDNRQLNNKRLIISNRYLRVWEISLNSIFPIRKTLIFCLKKYIKNRYNHSMEITIMQ